MQRPVYEYCRGRHPCQLPTDIGESSEIQEELRFRPCYAQAVLSPSLREHNLYYDFYMKVVEETRDWRWFSLSRNGR
jgi:hypothetical protein